MFENLKTKLKGFFSKAEEKIEIKEEPAGAEKEETKKEEILEEVKEELKETGFKPEEVEKAAEKVTEEIKEEPPVVEPTPGVAEEEKGFFKLVSKITHKELSAKDLDPILWELEITLLENDVAKEIAEKINQSIKETLLSKKTKRGKVEEFIKDALKKSVDEILSKEKIDIIGLIKEKRKAKEKEPFVIIFFGFNGTGKTLTIAKFAKLMQSNNISVVLAAGDTFRAAAIEQLEEHAQKLGLPVIKQKKGADSAAVIFDAVKHAKSKGIDVVLADTAGRSHTNINLMDELKKICKVNKPDLKIFVGDSLTGNDAAQQAKLFKDAVGIDASVLTKTDCDVKGGACLSVSYITGKPIIYLGTGQNYEDMIPFDKGWFLGKVF